MKKYETPDAQVTVFAPDTAIADTEVMLPLSALVPQN